MQSRLRWVATVLALVVALPLAMPAASARSPRGRTAWSLFKADRVKLLETLAPAFVSCFQRRDSLIDPLSPIFHGCLDWHSAVHAAYSHHVLHRRTGDDKYLELINNQFAPQGVSLVPAEELYERAKAPDLPLTENPYGFGWFLVLARERETSLKNEDLRSMADFAAEQMTNWFNERLSSGDAQSFILNKAHPNYSWSLMNLDLWAKYTGDKKLRQVVVKASKPLRDKGLDGFCDLEAELTDDATGFQSPCLMRLAALAQIFGRSAKDFVDQRVPSGLRIDPIEKPSGCHAGGLNFTRAYGLWRLYELTGRSSYRDNYAELIRYHVGRPDLYEGEMYFGQPDYMCYSHWVAQVGVRAISLSYE